MAKKSTNKFRTIAPPRNDSGMLGDIHKKIASSAALNGGFDTLLYKIDKIEQSQGELVGKVDKIHDAIYDPNDGLFSKMSETKLENSEKFSAVEAKLADISTWKNYKEKNEEKKEGEHDEAVVKIVSLEKSVDSLVKSKNATWSVLKWLGVALGGGILTLAFKWLETILALK